MRKGLGMEASKTEILAFIPKLEASRQNVVDEIIYESRIQTEKPHKEKNSTRLDQLFAEAARIQGTIAAFREEAEIRR